MGKRRAPLLAGAAFLIFGGALWAGTRHLEEKTSSGATGLEFEIRWNSMEGILNPGQTIRTTRRKPAKGDVVILRTGMSEPERIAKKVLAVEGDRFGYRNSNVYVNGELQKTSWWAPYRINSEMLAQYAKEYPTLPKGALLLMGNLPDGSYDSSEFGLADVSDVIGIVIR